MGTGISAAQGPAVADTGSPDHLDAGAGDLGRAPVGRLVRRRGTGRAEVDRPAAGHVAVQVALVVALMASVGAPTLDTAVGWVATSYAGWPGVGLSALLFARAGRHGWPAMMLVQTVGLGIVLSLTYDVQWWLGASASLAVTLPASLSAWLLRPGTAAVRRFHEGEVDAYHGVTAVVGLVCGVMSAVAVAVAGRGDPTHVVLTGLISTFAATTAQLVVLPFHLRHTGGWAPGRASVEMWGQRAALATALAVVFAPEAMLPVTFVLFPVLGWVAIRGSAAETHQQVLLVAVVAFGATLAGHGPLALTNLDNHTELGPLMVYLAIASVCYLIVPLALTVERLRGVTRQAVRSATTVERMLDSASGTVFLAADPDGVITHGNEGAEIALGMPVAALIGRSTHTLHTDAEIRRQLRAIGPDDIDPTQATTQQAYNAAVMAQVRRGVRRDWEFVRSDGELRTISLNITVMTEPGGAMIGFLASGEDVTERTRAQAALEQAYQRERDAVTALREADDMKRKLVSVVSHELRTPVTTIVGFSEVLREGGFGELNPQQTSAVARIERNSTRLRQLVDNLLVLSETEAGRAHLRHDDVDLNEVVRAAQEQVMFQTSGRRLETRLALEPAPVVVRGDHGMLERAVVHLWSNAIKFTPDGGTITISTSHGPSGSVTVADTGMGIAADEHSDVFSRFYRTAEAATLAIQGPGLGLSVVATIVSQHEGTIDLDSTPGRGTRLTISIPG